MKVVGLHRYPMKSLRGHGLSSARVSPLGIEGDRRWMVVDTAGKFLTIREIPQMTLVDVESHAGGIVLSHAVHGSVVVDVPRPGASERQVTVWRDSVSARSTDPAAGAFLSEILGRQVALVYLDDELARPVDATYAKPGDHVGFADGFPILVTTTGSLDRLNAALAQPVEMARFRPNIVVETEQPWLEDSWKAIRIGALTLRIVKPCARCVITTRDPKTGEQPDPREPLMTLGKIHRAGNGGIIFGQNAISYGNAVISIGDEVEILESGESNLGVRPAGRRRSG